MDHGTQRTGTNKNIVLIGFMGAGKTTVGRMLAEKLGRTFIDSDQEVEAIEGMPISRLFKEKGEAYFREAERKLITRLCTQQHGNVLSLGGGAYLQEEIKNVCLTHGIVVFLSISWDAWMNRYASLIDERPILQNRTLEEVRALFDARQAAYAAHHLIVHIDEQRPEDIVAFLLRELKQAARQ
ncbi:shikimate kinase [Aneurinibacillus sp. BA2021]|nr:shikimate kinase [Aneurinibacillus sp. BA2021]